ncbi:MAG TPA: DedA family protein [Gemmatimonadales bacterium]|nr:DedA family protein [Gemmatimonadales bacterium]
MELLKDFIDLFLHLDKHLSEVIQHYGTGTYLILFLIVFCETGLVVTPFLPGDSLLFAAGTFAGLGDLDVGLVFAILCAASILGDSSNYWVGRLVGRKAFESRFIKQEHLLKTQAFYDRHGRKTIILARFLPILRTFAPFVAGVGVMPYPRFLTVSVLGSVAWVGLFVWAGYLFGNLRVVRENFTLVVMAIIVLSVMPMVIEIIKTRRSRPA